MYINIFNKYYRIVFNRYIKYGSSVKYLNVGILGEHG